jgi:ketosteroid isomerase-like protein
VPDPAQVRRLAQQLRTAFDSGDLDLLGTLIAADARWGWGAGGCHNRAQVLEWYGVLQAQGVRSRVSEALVRGDAVVLGFALAGKGGGRLRSSDALYQVFKVADGAVVEIRGYPDRAEALASATD